MSGQGRSTWTPAASQPPQRGYVLDGGEPHEVSFKTGGPTSGETLTTDGNYSADNDGFRTYHDHYGSGDGPNDNGTDRGHYTGPGH